MPKGTQVMLKAVKGGADSKYVPLRMDELTIDVKVVANLAVTTSTMKIHNDLDSVLEGRLNFPLGEGQTVSRFAMTVNSKLREGVVEEKAKGRQVFESIVRQGIDPGLLEWTKGNVFKARVYPIPAKETKRSSSPMSRSQGCGQRLLLLLSATLHLQRRRSTGFTYGLRYSKRRFARSRFQRTRQPAIREMERILCRRDQEGKLPAQPKPCLFASQTKRKARLRRGKGRKNLLLPPRRTPKSSTKTMPKKIGRIWDASASARNRNPDKK